MTSPESIAPAEPLVPPAPALSQPRKLLQRTVFEGLRLMALNLIIVPVFQALNLRIFLASAANSKALEMLRDMNPLALLALGVFIAAPIIEESVFRGLPYLLWKRVGRDTSDTRNPIYWLLGGAAAILFSVSHGAGSLPLPQLLLGVWSWHVINTRGLRYSMVLHASYNLVPILLMLAGAGKVA